MPAAVEPVLRAGCLVFVLLLPAMSAAEPDAASYQTKAGALTDAERAAMRTRLAAEIAAERAREDEARRSAQAEAERIAADRAARPFGERLVEARCLICHDAGQIERTALGAPGWTVTVLRMEWLNGARLETGERVAIVAYLAARHTNRNVGEWAAVLAASVLAASLALGAWAFVRKRWSARRGT